MKGLKMRSLVKDQLSLQVLRALPISCRSEMGTYIAICLLGKDLHKTLREFGPIKITSDYFKMLRSIDITIITKVGTVGKRSDDVEPYRKRGQEIQSSTEKVMRGVGIPDITSTALGSYLLQNQTHQGHILMVAVDVILNEDNTIEEEERVAELVRNRLGLEPINANTRRAGLVGDKSRWAIKDHPYELDYAIFE
jgi:hypothetical protein